MNIVYKLLNHRWMLVASYCVCVVCVCVGVVCSWLTCWIVEWACSMTCSYSAQSPPPGLMRCSSNPTFFAINSVNSRMALACSQLVNKKALGPVNYPSSNWWQQWRCQYWHWWAVVQIISLVSTLSGESMLIFMTGIHVRIFDGLVDSVGRHNASRCSVTASYITLQWSLLVGIDVSTICEWMHCLSNF